MTKITKLLACAAAPLFLSGAAHAAPAGAVKNVVLVHGAFADGSGWQGVAEILMKDGYKVSVVQHPETSLEDDVAATNRVLDALDGPAVLVGHSYGGMVISGAGNNPHVKSLVYVAAFAPDVGESLGSLQAGKPPASNAIAPTKDGAYLLINQAQFHADFAADLPQAQTDFMALSQVPLSVKSAGGQIAAPAWKTKPSYGIVATEDRSINPELERWMYKRAGSVVSEVKGSHVIYMSQARFVADVIEKAANAH